MPSRRVSAELGRVRSSPASDPVVSHAVVGGPVQSLRQFATCALVALTVVACGWTNAARASLVTYTLTGTRPSFNTPTYFPLTIGWPSKPGVYGLPVKQKCEGETNVWDVPDGPATANQPSPPLYPLPQIKVLKAR